LELIRKLLKRGRRRGCGVGCAGPRWGSGGKRERRARLDPTVGWDMDGSVEEHVGWWTAACAGLGGHRTATSRWRQWRVATSAPWERSNAGGWAAGIGSSSSEASWKASRLVWRSRSLVFFRLTQRKFRWVKVKTKAVGLGRKFFNFSSSHQIYRR
jgi:hypothetical protein